MCIRDRSYCVLVSGNRNEQTRKRLKALCATTDGFKIAEEDLALRGPGDFLGSRQHGLPLFTVADLQLDIQTLLEAKQAAGEEIRDAETLEQPEYAALRTRVPVSYTHLAESEASPLFCFHPVRFLSQFGFCPAKNLFRD